MSPISDSDLKNIDPLENLKSRLSWLDYAISIAFLVSQRSFDPSSKCGCVIIDRNKRILTTGYNGPIKNSDDSMIPLTRPSKYHHMIHAEENALLSYSGSHQDIQNAICIVTNRPCSRCLRGLIQKGITDIYYCDNNTMVVNEEDIKEQELMLTYHKNINMVEISFKRYSKVLRQIKTRINEMIKISKD